MVIDVDAYLKEGRKCRDCGSKATWLILVGAQWNVKLQRLTGGQYIPFCDVCVVDNESLSSYPQSDGRPGSE